MGSCLHKFGKLCCCCCYYTPDQPEVSVPPAPPAPPVPPPWNIYIAMFDYQPRTSEDLGFRRGESLTIIDRSKNSWWLAQVVGTDRKGYVPSNYLAQKSDLRAAPWFFGKMSRADAEKLLHTAPNKSGSFLIRESETITNSYALSVRSPEKIRHYRIFPMDNHHVCISRNRTFENLYELVGFYQRQCDGLITLLINPCVQIEVPTTEGLSYDTVDHWEIDRSSIKMVKIIGTGNFGEVWEGLWNDTTRVAVKTLKKGKMDKNDFLQEAQLMKKLRHKNLIQLYAICTLEEPIYIITEIMKNGSLHDYLKRPEGRSLQVPQMVEMASQVASGMAYLESQNYIHRDLAARNILVSDAKLCKVADFGLARLLQENVFRENNLGKFPVRWTSPEAAKPPNLYSIKSDVWSFGILLYEIFTFAALPYRGMTNGQVLQQLNIGYRLPIPQDCPELLHSHMMKCWDSDPNNRPTFDTLKWQLEEFFMMDATDYFNTSEQM
uniref:tyrosine-protein kinase Src42A-like n=1 Tax=Myxine glutinosa TaxID=7769 RepID=UPI00358F0D0C